MSKLANIISGWGNYIFPSEKGEKLARERAKICSECSYLVEGGLIPVVMPDEIIEVQGMQCDKCKCFASTKVRDMKKTSKCPKQKW